MNQDPSKLHLRSEQASELVATSHTSTRQAVREFGSVEEMIRADREAIQTPESISQRLNESVSREPKPQKPWRKKIFSRNPE